MPTLYYDNGGGAGGGVAGADIRAATFIIAASNSEHATAADYVCDGIADDVQINAALNALPANGGRVVLLDGTFVLADSIVIPNDIVSLEGQGYSTFINGNGLPSLHHAIVVNSQEYTTLKNFSIRTNSGGAGSNHCIDIRDGSNYARVIDVTIRDSNTNGINIAGSSMSNIWIERVHIEGADVYGINIGLEDLDVIFRLHISDCEIGSADSGGIAVTSCHDFQECVITDNFIHSCGNQGIYVMNAIRCTISGNICLSCAQEGINVISGERCIVEGNICYGNAQSGIEMTSCDLCEVHNNLLDTNDANDTGNFDGLSLFTCDQFVVTGNHCYANDRCGIYVDECMETLVSGNYCYDNGQDGIRVNTGADDCQIIGNILSANGSNGVDIAVATCDSTIVKDNRFFSNVGGEVSNSGTDSAFLELWFPVGFPDATHGGRPVTELPDAADTMAYVCMQVPMDFHELVGCEFVLIAEGGGDAVFTVLTVFGKICADEQQDAHSDGLGATTLTMTDDELECLSLIDALDDVAPGDNIGVTLSRDGDNQNDDLEATVNAVGIRFRYV